MVALDYLIRIVKEIKANNKKIKYDFKSNKELIVSVKVIPNFEKIGKDLTDEQIREIIWPKIKEVNKKLTSYKAIKYMEIKKDEFIKTTTMKIKRYVELQKDKTKE